MIPITLLLMHNGEGKEDLEILIIVAAAEIPAAIICYLLVDKPVWWGGRKNLMALAYGFVTIILFVGAFFFKENYYMFWICGCKFFIKIAHIITF